MNDEPNALTPDAVVAGESSDAAPELDKPTVPEPVDAAVESAASTETKEAAAAEPEVAAVEEVSAAEEEIRMEWYILKVQSNRETSIAEALRRRVTIEGLDEFFGDVIVPTEKVTEFKGGKRRVVQRKLYPGYILVQMLINDDTWFLVRETPGIGDFTGSGGKPTPMQPHEVHRIVSTQEEKTDETPKLKISFREGDRVKINEGTFENFEGEVSSLDQASGRVVVMIYDKADLDEDDIMPASLLVFGKSRQPLVKQVGSRWFLSPGLLEHFGVMTLEDHDDGIHLALFDSAGREVRRERLIAARAAKLRVSGASS